MGIEQSSFIKACRGKNEGRIPVWVMRQAGRYLPEYRAVREKVSFLELCRTPELIAEVVRQPIDRFGLDAGILFSDILTILEPMGAPVSFPEGGPRLENPIDSPEAVKWLHDFDIEKELAFVPEGIRKIKEILPDLPLIGFAGSPFTVSCYLIEGKGSKAFDKAKRFIHAYPKTAAELFELVSSVTERYLRMQIEAGADAVQLFESWGGTLSRDDFLRWSVQPTNRIFTALNESKVPRILFVNNLAPYTDLVSGVNCEVVGVDYRMDLADAQRKLPGKSVQGNLDPAVLFGPLELVAAKTQMILESIDDPNRLIFNLGHGIQPGAPVEAVEMLVKTVHEFR
ncbi:MAG: uroporphyrinogen decarboxylase [bacterium]|nr:uroporphyrinogen decarboxylase [bacterium]